MAVIAGRFTLLLALLLSAFSVRAEETVSSADPVPPFLGLVTGDRVNLRAGPSGSAEILFQLPRRARVQVLAAQGEWYAVPLPEPVHGYIHRRYLQRELEWGVVRGDRVYVRAGPGMGSSSFGTVSEGERLRVRGEQGAWVQVQPPGFCRGWVHRSFVTLIELESLPRKETS